MPQRLYRVNLPQANLTFTPYQPTVVDFKAPDMSLLAHSMDKVEQRQIAANQSIAAMDDTFAKLRDQLHNDPETTAWFNDYSNRYKQQVLDLAGKGYDRSTITAATRLAAEAINDPELKARISSNKEYEEWEKTIKARANAGNISQITAARVMAENPYKFNVIRDSQGNAIGGEGWKFTGIEPVDRVPTEKIVEEANKLVSEYTRQSQLGSTVPVDSQGNQISSGSSGGSRSSQSTSLIRSKEEARLIYSLDKLLAANPNYRMSLQQDYDDIEYLVKENEKLYEEEMAKPEEERDLNKAERYKEIADTERKKITGENGNYLSYDTYIKQTVYPQLKELAYRNTASGKETSFSLTPASTSRTKGDIDAAEIVNSIGSTGTQGGSASVSAKDQGYSINTGIASPQTVGNVLTSKNN